MGSEKEGRIAAPFVVVCYSLLDIQLQRDRTPHNCATPAQPCSHIEAEQ